MTYRCFYFIFFYSTIVQCSLQLPITDKPGAITKSHSLTVCSGQMRSIACPNLQLLHIYNAFYGKLSGHDCDDPVTQLRDQIPTCFSKTAPAIIRETCQGQQSCDLYAEDSLYHDPCPAVNKYMYVSFTCQGKSGLSDKLMALEQRQKIQAAASFAKQPIQEMLPQVRETGPKKMTAAVCSGQMSSIFCPELKLLKIQKGFYGKHKGRNCLGIQTNDTIPTCYARDTMTTLKNMCNGQQSCDLFSDPLLYGHTVCGENVQKYLQVEYVCEGQPDSKKDLSERATWKKQRSFCNLMMLKVSNEHDSGTNKEQKNFTQMLNDANTVKMRRNYMLRFVTSNLLLYAVFAYPAQYAYPPSQQNYLRSTMFYPNQQLSYFNQWQSTWPNKVEQNPWKRTQPWANIRPPQPQIQKQMISWGNQPIYTQRSVAPLPRQPQRPLPQIYAQRSIAPQPQQPPRTWVNPPKYNPQAYMQRSSTPVSPWLQRNQQPWSPRQEVSQTPTVTGGFRHSTCDQCNGDCSNYLCYGCGGCQEPPPEQQTYYYPYQRQDAAYHDAFRGNEMALSALVMFPAPKMPKSTKGGGGSKKLRSNVAKDDDGDDDDDDEDDDDDDDDDNSKKNKKKHKSKKSKKKIKRDTDEGLYYDYFY